MTYTLNHKEKVSNECTHSNSIVALWLFYHRGGCGYGSESEGEEPVDSRVTLPQNVPGRGNVKAQQSAIRLTEVQLFGYLNSHFCLYCSIVLICSLFHIVKK